MKYTIQYEGSQCYADAKHEEGSYIFTVNDTEKMADIVARMAADAEVVSAKVFANTASYHDFPGLPDDSLFGVPLYEKTHGYQYWSLTGQKIPRTVDKRAALFWIGEYEKAAEIHEARFLSVAERYNFKPDEAMIFTPPGMDKEMYDYSPAELGVIYKMKGEIFYFLLEMENEGFAESISRFISYYTSMIHGKEEDVVNAKAVTEEYIGALYKYYRDKADAQEIRQCNKMLDVFLGGFFDMGIGYAGRIIGYRYALDKDKMLYHHIGITKKHWFYL